MIALLLDFGDEYEVDIPGLAGAILRGVPGLRQVYVMEAGYTVRMDEISLEARQPEIRLVEDV